MTDELNNERKRERLLLWEGCANARDLGGYPTSDGGMTRWGAVVRSDSLWSLTASGQEALIAAGVRSIVDLRVPGEIERWPNPFSVAGTHGITYLHRSMIDPAAPDYSFDSLVDDYLFMLDKFGDQVAAVMEAIATAPSGTVLIHCAAGKDRTGVTSAFLLDLVGVPRQVIADDYAISAETLKEREAAWIEDGPGERADRARLIMLHQARPEVMLEVLTGLDQLYGGPEAYLLAAGVAPEHIAQLRARLRD